MILTWTKDIPSETERAVGFKIDQKILWVAKSKIESYDSVKKEAIIPDWIYEKFVDDNYL